MKITIHDTFHPWYYSYFLQGLSDLGLSYSFDTLIDSSTEGSLRSEGFTKDYFIISVREGGKEKFLVIGADDKTTVSSNLLSLADLYAKTNVSAQTQGTHGIVPIGPTFGVRYTNPKLYKLAIRDIAKGDYDRWKLLLKRANYDRYLRLRESPGKLKRIFYLNYPWKKHSNLTDFRKSIIKNLKALDEARIIEFEGGFSKRRFGYHPGLKDVSARKLYNHSDYIQALSNTKIALNTSAVHNCLGWKMGEFLCLGRCILTFPIHNVMPFTFEKGTHFFQIDDISELESQIKFLVNNPNLVNTIQRNARSYFDEHIAPARLMNRLLYML